VATGLTTSQNILFCILEMIIKSIVMSVSGIGLMLIMMKLSILVWTANCDLIIDKHISAMQECGFDKALFNIQRPKSAIHSLYSFCKANAQVFFVSLESSLSF